MFVVRVNVFCLRLSAEILGALLDGTLAFIFFSYSHHVYWIVFEQVSA